MSEVLIIFQPLAIQDKENPAIEPEQFDLLRDYTKLTPHMVALSTIWLRMWCPDAWLESNLMLFYKFLQNNTDETLWLKCLEEYASILAECSFVGYPPADGGPLMLLLILRRIQGSTETAIEHLVKRVQGLKISTMEGENVDHAVSLIKSTNALLVDSSTDERNLVPDSFPKTILQVFQTTSMPEFNKAFADIETTVRNSAIMEGEVPEYPTVDKILTMATGLYLSMSDSWEGADKTGAAFNANGHKTRSTAHYNCFNCGKPGHLAPECTLPPNPKQIEANRKKFLANKGPQHKLSKDGKTHLKKNKAGAYIVDSKKMKKLKSKADTRRAGIESVLKTMLPTANHALGASPPPANPADEGSPAEAIPNLGLIMEKLSPFYE